jgi:hypothetical protein
MHFVESCRGKIQSFEGGPANFWIRFFLTGLEFDFETSARPLYLSLRFYRSSNICVNSCSNFEGMGLKLNDFFCDSARKM